MKNNVFYLFALSYVDSHGNEITSNYEKNLLKFRNEFSFSDTDVNKFIEFASKKDVKSVENDFNKDKEYILARLKAQIARNYWKNEGWYSVMIPQDNQVEKALTLFDEAKDLANLK